MWVSGGWKDYELIDCSGGEKLERWGTHVLVRPDPQAIWNTPKKHPLWAKPDARYFRDSSGGGHWEKNQLPEKWGVRYKTLSFQVKPMNFKHTGLFPEQASNWDFIIKCIRESDRPVSVLNLFAYTGGATVAALSAGASVCHVDAARGMVAWARENAQLSGLSEKPVRWIVDDCVSFVEREIKRGRRYDAIIMDPPSYGRGPSGELWKLEDSIHSLVTLCTKVLSGNPLFFIISSYTTGLAPSALGYLIGSALMPRFNGRVESDELGLPVTVSGLNFPCGASGRWLRA